MKLVAITASVMLATCALITIGFLLPKELTDWYVVTTIFTICAGGCTVVVYWMATAP